MLTLLGRGRRRALGLDLSQQMLNIARSQRRRGRPGRAASCATATSSPPGLPGGCGRPRGRAPGAALPGRSGRGGGRGGAAGARRAGRLLIVDFAPHGLEFLREAAPAPPAGLLRRRDRAAGWPAPGLDARRRRPPCRRPATAGLTVKIWTAERGPPSADGAPHERRRHRPPARRALGPVARAGARGRRRAARRLVRVLAAEDAGGGGEPLGRHPPAGAARTRASSR